jgi:hypothetical protein
VRRYASRGIHKAIAGSRLRDVSVAPSE